MPIIITKLLLIALRPLGEAFFARVAQGHTDLREGLAYIHMYVCMYVCMYVYIYINIIMFIVVCLFILEI